MSAKKTTEAGKAVLDNASADEQLAFVREMLVASKVPEIPARYAKNKKLAELRDNLLALRETAYGFSRGDVNMEIKGRGFVTGCFKELQSKLRCLTWFASRLAAGDFEQRVDFMGDFSDAFNKMSSEFFEALKSLRDSETNLLKITKELHLSEERWQLAVSCTQDGVWDIDLMSKKAFLSPRCWEILRRRALREEVDFDPVAWGGLVHPDDLSKWVGLINSAENKANVNYGKQYIEFRMMDGDGKYRWIGVHHMVISNNDGIPCRFVGTCADIQETREREDAIRKQATHDQLTKLPNRYLYNDRFLQKMVMAKRNGSSLILMLWDLDRFKWVNDTYGHLAGDRLLVVVAEVMRSCLRETDTLARFGGDEFVMLLSSPSDHEEEVVSLAAARILEALTSPLDIGVEKVRIGASCGVSFFPRHTTDGEVLFSLADRALYEAKRTGKNKAVIWSPAQAEIAPEV